jgi:hypothetical protein
MVRDGSGRVHGNLIDGWDGAEPPGRNFRQTASVKAEDLLRWAHTFAPSLSRVCVVRVEHP